MKHTLQFDDSDAGRSNFEYLWDGVVMGASKGEAKTDQTIRQNAKIQRALILVSDLAVTFDKQQRPINARNLKPGAHAVQLEQGDIEHARKLILGVPWPGHHDIAVADLLDCLGAAIAAPEKAAG